MRTLIVADVHSNTEALEAIFQHADAEGGWAAVWCAGDIVGYGPDPSAVIEALRARDAVCVAGNHDRAATGRMPIDDFNAAAARAVLWTRERLTPADRAWLDALPETRAIGEFTLVHGSLREPLWEYLLNADQAAAHFAFQTTPYSIIGHSHLLFRVEERLGASHVFSTAAHGHQARLGDTRAIFNPGSAGQPRDADPRVSYLIYDDDARTMTWRRVTYDVERTQAKMRSAGLDGWLVERLAVGR